MFRRRTQAAEQTQQDWREAEQQAQPPRRLTDEERVINRARALMQNGRARGWSHAIALAADTLPRNDE